MTNPSPLDPRIIFPELHAALGFGFTLAFLEILPPSWRLGAYLLREAVLLVKEAWFDPRFEGPSQPFFWQGLQDFLWYHAGDALALGLARLA